MKAVFRISRIYDLSESGGIGFFWNGVGRGHVDFLLLSPTGAWIGKFSDFGEKTWVALKWEDLQEVDIDGSRPDKTQITGILWTVHSAGERRLDGIYGIPKGGDPDVFAKMVLIRTASLNLMSSFMLKTPASEIIFSKFTVAQGIENLPAEFVVRDSFDVSLFAKMEIEPVADLYAKFVIPQGSESLPAEFAVRNFEDFTTYNLVNNDGCTFSTGPDTKVQSSGLKESTDSAYVYKDFGIDHLTGDFTWSFEFYPLDVSISAAGRRCAVASFWNQIGDYIAIRHTSPAVLVVYDCDTDGPSPTSTHLKLETRDGAGGGSSVFKGYVPINPAALNYCLLKRRGTRYILEVYSDSGYTSLLGAYSLVADAYDLRYGYAIQSLDYAPIYNCDVYIQNWDMQSLIESQEYTKDLAAEFIVN